MSKSSAKLRVVEQTKPEEPTAEQMGELKFDQKFRELPRQAGMLADALWSDSHKLAREVRGTVFQHEKAKERIKAMRGQLDALEALL